MTRTTALILGTLLVGLTTLGSTTSAQGPWTTLLDGSLKGWNIVGDANWEVVDGVVQANKGTGIPRDARSVRRLSDHAGLLGDRRRQ